LYKRFSKLSAKQLELKNVWFRVVSHQNLTKWNKLEVIPVSFMMQPFSQRQDKVLVEK
jgi:hypothetical protein